MRHLALNLSVDLQEKSIEGTASLDFARRAPAGKSLRLDAVAFQLRSVSLSVDDAPLRKLTEGTEYHYDGDVIEIWIPDGSRAGQVLIDYRAVPRQGLYFLAPDKEVPDRPWQVWSQCQDEDGRHWFPCQDKPHAKMTSEMRVTVPHGMTALSGGELAHSSQPEEGPWLYHYKLNVPTPAYLMTLVVGEFDEWQDQTELPSGRVIPLRFLVPPGRLEEGRRAFGRTAEMIELFSKITGVEYPWDRYSQVVVADFIFGGMENTTATTMYEHILLDERAALDVESHDLVAHELAHQWFGDLLTCRDWPHAWLNEGFATYFELVEKEARLGRDEYDQGVAADFEVYLGEANGNYKRPIVCRDYEDPIDLFDRHLYQKGGVVLHLLRRQLGEECFWQGIRDYLEKHRSGIVETTNLVRALEEASGLSLDQFFDHWVYRPGHPELDIKISYDDDKLTVDVEQTQKGEAVPVFELCLAVEVTIDGNTKLHQRTISERKSSLVVRAEKRPSLVVIDPDYLLAATIQLQAPQDLLRSMLERAPRARARRMAATALGKRHDPDNVEALGKALDNQQETWIVRSRAATSLGKIRGHEAHALLQRASNDPHPKVRRAVAQALGQFDDDQALDVLQKLAEDESYLVTAQAARSLGSTKRSECKKTLEDLLSKSSWAEVIRAGALDGLSQSNFPEAVDHLIEWSRYGKPLRARRAAIQGLPRASDDRKVRDHLSDLLRDRDPHTRAAALSALGKLGDRKAQPAISELLERELDGRVKRQAKKVLADLGKTGTPGLSEARQKTQKLQQELSELKTRLSRLEQLSDRAGENSPAARGKKATAKKTATKKTAAKKTAAKKTAAKKTAAKKATAKKTAKKTTAKATKKTASRKTGGRVAKKKATGKKTTPRKTTTQKRSTNQKSSSKTSKKSSGTKKSPARRAPAGRSRASSSRSSQNKTRKPRRS